MREALRREDALRGRTRGFRARVARSGELIAEGLELAPHAYVALSGGKDSLVALALAAGQRPGITAIWVDDELEDADTAATVARQCAAVGATLRSKTGTQRHAGWFTPWRDPPYWRQPQPECLVTRQSVRVLAPRWGHDGVILGTRAAESAGRLIGARRYGPIHALPHMRLATIAPLQWWDVADIWAAIAEWGLPYHPGYDAMSRAGIERAQQRIGPLCLTPGWVLDAAQPGLRRRLEERYGPHW